MLTSLDNKIGDGDHGLNMKRGFSYAIDALIKEDINELKSCLVHFGKNLMSKVGGASGPLYGMAFIKGADNIKGKDWTYENLKHFINDGSKAIRLLGKANLGDKTMYDVWKPLSYDLNNNIAPDILLKNIVKYRDHTKDELALKGRAAFLKEMSVGTVDPGSFSSEIIFKHLIGGLE